MSVKSSREHAAQVAALSLLGQSGSAESIERTGTNNHSNVSINSAVSIPPVYTNYGYPMNATPLDNCLTEGAEVGGKLSAVRRFFSLFATFDFLFTTLLWLVCVASAGDFKVIIPDQIKHTSITTSLFDIVYLSLCRVVVLLLAYALWRLQHWWVVAVTTFTSSAYLLAKVFLYQWSSNTGNYSFSVILILCSFVISWGETWFIDFRVIPQESRAKEIIAANSSNERRPILTTGGLLHYGGTGGTESVGTFYSPLESNVVSDEEGEEESSKERRYTQQEKEYIEIGKKSLEEAWSLIHSGGWTQEKETEEGDTIHSKTFPKTGKMFKLTAKIMIEPKRILDDLFYSPHKIPHWNPTVNTCQVLQTIDDHTDITYNVSADAAGGAVSSRDFVVLRHWQKKGIAYVSAGVSVTHPNMPPQKGCVRGHNNASAYIFWPECENNDACMFQWLLNTDLKGWLPHKLIETTLSSVMLEFVKHLRNRVDELNNLKSSGSRNGH